VCFCSRDLFGERQVYKRKKESIKETYYILLIKKLRQKCSKTKDKMMLIKVKTKNAFQNNYFDDILQKEFINKNEFNNQENFLRNYHLFLMFIVF
jgi:hypothetical protein